MTIAELEEAIDTGLALFRYDDKKTRVLEFVIQPVPDSEEIASYNLDASGMPEELFGYDRRSRIRDLSLFLDCITLIDVLGESSQKCTCDFLSVILITGCRCGGQ